MSLIHLLNEFVDRKMKKEYIPGAHKPLSDEAYTFFKNNGEGLYNICVESKNNDFVAKIISLVTGKYSHGFTLYYHENIFSKLMDEEWQRLRLKYYSYYGDSIDIDEKLKSIKVLCLASADSNGMNYKDYSAYQNRTQVIMKPTLTEAQTNKVLHSYFTPETMNAVYDYTGLAFWWLNKMFDDERAYYCSELIYDKFSEVGIKVAQRKDPSPTEIVNYGIEHGTVIGKV